MSPPRRAGTAPQAFETLLGGYHTPAGQYDELLAGRGRLRAAWEAFARHTPDLSAAGLTTAQARVTRQIHENGVTYNTYATQDGPARPWALDVLPMIVGADDWAPLSASVAQLARLLNLAAADIYGPGTLVREGIIPPALVFRHPGFLRPCHGVRPPLGIYLQHVAFDLARAGEGGWQIVNIRTQTPAGAGYALENRATIARMFPDAFRELHVQAIAPYFAQLRETMLQTAPCDDGAPRIVLLTPGPYSGRYFEHAYLARHLGFTLVEGADLTVRHDRVFLKTISGLRQVHAVVRHLADDFCDPLELRADSALGVPGLVQAWRTGRVLVANAFGSGVLESPALRGLLPALSARLLGEPLAASVLPAWWGGDRSAVDAIVHSGRSCVVRGAYGSGSLDPIEHCDARELPARLNTPEPDTLVVEPPTVPSRAPVWHDGRLESRPLILRVFAIAKPDGGYLVMDGGLTRIAAAQRPTVTSGSGGSKDTWVLPNAPIAARPAEGNAMLPMPIDAGGDGTVSSRAAEHLFWLGRYVERAETCARLLRTALAGLGDPSRPEISRDVFGRLALAHGLLDRADPGFDDLDAMSAQGVIRLLVGNMFDAQGHQSLAFNVRQTVRVAGAIRDRLSGDNWRLLNQLFSLATVRPAGPLDLHEALALLERAIVSLVAVAGLEMAHMSRDHGWRFLSVGRQIERILAIVAMFRPLRGEVTADPAVLEWILHASDSLGAYRTRYGRRPEWTTVAELLLVDPYNPRSLSFQVAKIARHVPQLPGADALEVIAELSLLERALHDAHGLQADLAGASPSTTSLLERCEQVATRLSETLTSRYFSHAYELPHVTGAGQ